MEIFTERLIPKKPEAKEALLAGLILFSALVLGAGLFFLFSLVGLAAGAGCVALAVFLMRRVLFVEYEYTLTNEWLEIDKIYDKRSRKALKQYDLRTVSAVGPYRGGEGDCLCSDRKAAGLYYLTSEEDGRRETIVIEPNAAMLKAFARYMGPRFTQ